MPFRPRNKMSATQTTFNEIRNKFGETLQLDQMCPVIRPINLGAMLEERQIIYVATSFDFHGQ